MFRAIICCQTQDSDLQESALHSELSIDDVTVNAATNVQQQLPPDLRTRREVVVDHRIIGPGDRTSELPTSTRAVQWVDEQTSSFIQEPTD